jgi:hypothetical protein
VGSIVFGGSGLIAMQQQQASKKPEARNELSCSQEVQKEVQIIQALRNSSGSRTQQKPEIYYQYCGGKPEYLHDNNNGVNDYRDSMKPYYPGL